MRWDFGPVLVEARRERWLVELVDEGNPAGAICIHRADGDGSGAMTMPQDVYWALQSFGTWSRAGRPRDTEGNGAPLQYRGVDVVALPATLAHLRIK